MEKVKWCMNGGAWLAGWLVGFSGVWMETLSS